MAKGAVKKSAVGREQEHTPWKLGPTWGNGSTRFITEGDGAVESEDENYVAEVRGNTPERRDARAHLIVTAVNSHPQLVEALQKCAAVLAGDSMSKNGLIEALESARAALTLAGVQ